MQHSDKLTINEARATLGVTADSSPDEIRAAYKSLALTHHPDKNNNSAESTTMFQRVSAAYETCSRYKEGPVGFEGGFSGGRRPTYEYDEADEADDDFDEQGPYGHSSAFFEYMFHNMFNGAGGHGHGGGGRNPFGSRSDFEQFRRHMPPESPDRKAARLAQEEKERQERVTQRLRDEAARQKRERYEKAERERIREEEMKAGAARRENKNLSKKQAAANARVHGAAAVLDQLRIAQARRSEVFAAARAGRADLVRKGVWEDNVAAGEPERLPGFVADQDAEKENVGVGQKGKGKQSDKADKESAETLVHIAAKRGDAELVEWLVDHGATPDERDDDDYTAFHHGLVLGSVPLVNYYLSTHPPPPTSSPTTPPDASYPPPPEHTLLSLAVTSTKADVVKLVVPYATADDAWDNWCYVEDCQVEKQDGEWEEIKWALTDVEGFTPPPGYQRRPRRRS